VILLGGKEDRERGEQIVGRAGPLVFNSCGQYNLNQSASLVRQANTVLTNDTGLMHVAAAFNKRIVSVWGNTIPAFGMVPYLPEQFKQNAMIAEVSGLSCRPCSKIGFKECPKKHFNCMNKIDIDPVVAFLKKHPAPGKSDKPAISEILTGAKRSSAEPNPKSEIRN
jgi:ADP-heptose:LPS heptosyltransferase